MKQNSIVNYSVPKYRGPLNLYQIDKETASRVAKEFTPLKFKAGDIFVESAGQFYVRGRNNVTSSWDYGLAFIDAFKMIHIMYRSGEKETFQMNPLGFSQHLIEIDRDSFIKSLGLYNDPGTDGDYSFLQSPNELARYCTSLAIYLQNHSKERCLAEIQMAYDGIHDKYD